MSSWEMLGVTGLVIGLCLAPGAAPAQPIRDGEEHTASTANPEPDIRIDGVIVSSEPSAAVVLVRRPGARRGRALSIGDTWHGFELLGVFDGGGLFRHDGKLLEMTLEGDMRQVKMGWIEPGGPANPSQRPPEPLSAIPVLARHEFQRATLEERLIRELPVIVTQMDVAPRVESASITGFRITELPSETVLSEAGLEAGDVLVSVNDVPFDAAPRLTDLYPRLRWEDEIRLVIDRRGRRLQVILTLN